MEPISILFSSFLTGMTSGIHNQLTDVTGIEIQAEVVEYQNQKIDYQYQLWKIKDKSVCSRSKSNNLSNHSLCTITAKQFFTETCSYLQANPQQHWKYTKLKNMYCVAAANFNPTIAQLSRPNKAEAEQWEAKQKCSLLTLEARNTGNQEVAQKRDAVCASLKK
jgi:hypothetical protein